MKKQIKEEPISKIIVGVFDARTGEEGGICVKTILNERHGVGKGEYTYLGARGNTVTD